MRDDEGYPCCPSCFYPSARHSNGPSFGLYEPGKPCASCGGVEVAIPVAGVLQGDVDAATAISNPPVPGGWRYMTQAQVTPEMTAWAIAILHDPTAYPMFAVSTRYFDGYKWTLARVEHHSNATRGVSLFLPIAGWTNP